MGAFQSAPRTDHINLLDLDSYKFPIRRLSEGASQCSKYVKMVEERAELELKYAISLRDWAEKWEKTIAKGRESETVKEAWQSHVKEARDLARLHDNCSQRIREEVIPHMKNWKHENYHKKKIHLHWKEISRAKRGFRTAQKPWKRKLRKVNNFKRAYHKACKVYNRRRLTVTDLAVESDPNFDSYTDQQQSEYIQGDAQLIKYRDRITKAKSDYKTSLRELLMPRYKDKYKNDMYVEFRKCQEAEGSRINNLLKTIRKYKGAVDLSTNQRLRI